MLLLCIHYIHHYCVRDGLDAFHGLSFTRWWNGNVAACWRHVVVMCVVLLLVLLGLPLLLLTETEKDIADVVDFANCVSFIFKRNKE